MNGMSNAMSMGSTTSSLFSVGVVVDTLGILAGIFALFIIVRSLKKVGGQVGSAFTLALIGVIAQTLALLESLLVTHLRIFPEPNFVILQGHEIHDTLMVIGMLFFVIGAKKFSDLSA